MTSSFRFHHFVSSLVESDHYVPVKWSAIPAMWGAVPVNWSTGTALPSPGRGDCAAVPPEPLVLELASFGPDVLPIAVGHLCLLHLLD